MISTQVIIPAPDDQSAWLSWIATIGITKKTNQPFLFENYAAEGLVNAFQVGPDIYVRVWQISMNCERVFEKQKWKGSIALTLLYVLTPEFFFLRGTGFGLQLNKPDSPVLMLIPPDAETQFELTSYHTVKLVEIGLTDTFFSMWPVGQFLLSMDNRFPVIRMKMCSLPISEQVAALLKASLRRDEDSQTKDLLIQSLLNALLTDFTTFPQKSDQKETPTPTDNLEAVEQYILAHLREPLPALQVLARNAGMSETFLKRHFKSAYEKSVYQYYLFHKMRLARRILEEGNISVNGLAEELGYQKVSHFIALFKKHHGYAPGAAIRGQKLLK